MGTVRYTVVDGEVLSELRGGVKRDYVPDPLGSTVALLDSTQAITDTFSYWPYGESAGRTGTTATPFQYVGTMGYYTDSSGRNYVRARYLDKVKGRWVTEDPLGFVDQYNLYNYCMKNPYRYTDKQGTSCWMEIPENWWWEIPTLGAIYSHAYIKFDKPCEIRNPAHSLFPTTVNDIGLWPIGLKPNNPKQRGGNKVRCGTSPQFEKALCDCVNYRLINPGFGIGIVCGSYASAIWECARNKAKDDNDKKPWVEWPPDYPWIT